MAKKIEETAQFVLMQRIKESLPTNLSLVDELADLLKISNDSAYRRIRGETQLSIEEIASICKHFKISFDAFINNTNDSYVSFSHHQLGTHVNTFKEYLTSIKKDLEQILKFPESNRQVLYAAEDIPVFQNFAQPNLTAFKIFYWNKSILNAKGFEEKKFDAEHVENELLDIAASIYELYAKIDSSEVWSDDTVNSTLKQVEFYWDAGYFNSKKDALLICEDINLMFVRICKQAEMNMKLTRNLSPATSHQNFNLYHSDIMIGSNCILSIIGEMKATYISYHSFNAMSTTNQSFCNETDLWFKNLIKKSSLISGVAEKQRYRYFKKVDEMLKRLVHKIEND